MSYIALVDCNNFFVSCERVFDPGLFGRPVVILSSNDGCIISRSPEAKALGIPMGAAHFQWKDFLIAHNVAIYSSNFPLYADMSRRVMETLAHFNPDLEIYSIDEAFLFIEDKDPYQLGVLVREKVLKWTGIEISVGIAKTKTLAKVANKKAKKNPSLKGVFFPTGEELASILDHLPVEEVWGIGSRLSGFLKSRGIHMAKQLCEKDDLWIRKNLTVTGLQTVWELKGIPCLSIDQNPPPKKSIMTSRSFGRAIVEKEEVFEALANFTSRGSEKLREEKRLATWIMVFIMTNPNAEDMQYANQASLVLPEATDFTPTLLEYARKGFEAIFRSGLHYKRAGVLLGGLSDSKVYQSDLFTSFSKKSEIERAKQIQLMSLMDKANERYGYDILQFASTGRERSWKGKCSQKTACFTTRWEEILTIQI